MMVSQSGCKRQFFAAALDLSPSAHAPLSWLCGLFEHIHVQFFIQHGQVFLCCGSQQFSSHCGQNAVIAGSMVAQGVLQLRCHQTGVACTIYQMFKTRQQFFTACEFRGKSGTNAAEYKILPASRSKINTQPHQIEQKPFLIFDRVAASTPLPSLNFSLYALLSAKTVTPDFRCIR